MPLNVKFKGIAELYKQFSVIYDVLPMHQAVHPCLLLLPFSGDKFSDDNIGLNLYLFSAEC